MKLNDLKAEQDIFLNCVPYRLVLRQWMERHRQKWLAVPLYVSNSPVEIVINQSDEFHLSKTHGLAAHA